MSEIPLEYYTEMKRISFAIQNFESDSAAKSTQTLKAQNEMIDLLKSIKLELKYLSSIDNRLIIIQNKIESNNVKLWWMSFFFLIFAGTLFNHLEIKFW